MRKPDHAFDECVAGARRVVDSGGMIFQKWWCTGCGARCSANTPNKMTHFCLCEHCGAMTDAKENGCGFTAIVMI